MSELVIGLTGGIGSGKTTVSDLFSDKGVDIIDADVIAREVVEPGSKALSEIVDHFGKDALQHDGYLNRNHLRNIVFNDPQQKRWLDALLHPVIREEMRLQTSMAKSPYCILAIPLLIENQLQHIVDRILVVDVSENNQLKRASLRDGADENQIHRIMSAQSSREQRLQYADDVIDNNTSTTDLLPQVDKLHQYYLNLVKSHIN